MKKTSSPSQQTIENSKQGAVLGALVADAATLGFHWLYDQERVAEIGGTTPEFFAPNEENYEGVAGYFAHPGKQVGEQTHYGEQLLVGLRSLAESHGEWKPFHYLSSFSEHFDRGGRFNGYIDAATGGTLTNHSAANESLLAEAEKIAPGIEEYPLMIAKKYSQTKGLQASGDELVEQVLKTARILFTDAKTLDQIEKVVRYYDEHRTFIHGADDNQIPAFSKVPPLVARYAGDPSLLEKVEEAVRITNNNDEAVAFSLFGARALEAVILGDSIPDALAKAAKESPESVQSKIIPSLDFKYEKPAEVSEKFGMVCYVHETFPVASAILNTVPDYVTGVRENILAGGDNAGRSIFVGALLGAAHGLGSENGIPLSWLAKLKQLDEKLVTVEKALA